MSFDSYRVVFCAPIPIWDRESALLHGKLFLLQSQIAQKTPILQQPVAMVISSSFSSNSFGDSSSSPSPSSSHLPASSIDSIPESREPTPEWDPTAAYEALAPLHWDVEEFDQAMKPINQP